MNALRPTVQCATLNAMKRGKATMAAPIQGVHNLSPQSAVPPHLRVNMNKGFKANFLSDPSTYPIIVILGCAMTFMTGMGFHALAYYKDVKISPSKKGSLMQTWGDQKVNTVVSVIGQNSYYKPTFTEGLGVNHDEWLKAKAAERAANGQRQ